MPRKILGLSAFYHDSAAALTADGETVFAAHEERFTRLKHDASFPGQAVLACLEQGGRRLPGGKPLTLGDLDAAVFYEKPLLKFERLLETHYARAPGGLRQFTAAMPVWIKEKLFLKKVLRDKLSGLGLRGAEGVKLLFTEHHLSHAASAFYPSPFGEAAILTVDGVGEWAAGSIGHGRGGDIEVLREQRFPHSLGLLYSAFTYYTGFRVNSGEYKLMGLAPYGEPGSGAVKKFREKILSELADIKPDGSLRLNQDYFDYAVGPRMVVEEKWEELFGLPPRAAESALTREYCDLALAIQEVTEETVLKLAREAKRLTGSKNLCLAGGVALNCAANGRLLRENIFDGLWIQPAAGDAGGALGAALAAHHIYFGEPRAGGGKDRMRGALLGAEYTEADALAMAAARGAVWERLENGELFDRTAGLLAGGAVVGWHQGREEWGPRALGNRSILGDARDPEMQRKLNLKIKHRESFRPFAPSVLAEDAGLYFEKSSASPYMLLTDYVREERRESRPDAYASLAPLEKLRLRRSDIPAVTHLDYSARVQTVDAGDNPRYHALLGAFKKRTGCGLLVNTSFNVRGEPIVSTPGDAYRCFMRTELDYLVIGNLLFDKKQQPPWREKL
ncbi:MAG: carbamoyltransferase [Elusimicrobia bacterium]|nr:carbamoyltransferase [Elusimicrobiota bacterium]